MYITAYPSTQRISHNAQTLTDCGGAWIDIGKKLKAKYGWRIPPELGNDTDDYGFSALSGGTCDVFCYQDTGLMSARWTSTDNSYETA